MGVDSQFWWGIEFLANKLAGFDSRTVTIVKPIVNTNVYIVLTYTYVSFGCGAKTTRRTVINNATSVILKRTIPT